MARSMAASHTIYELEQAMRDIVVVHHAIQARDLDSIRWAMPHLIMRVKEWQKATDA